MIAGGLSQACQRITRDRFSRLISSVKNETGILAEARPNPDLPRVLLVEDEQPIRDIIVPWLFRDGFDRREAADGGAAIERLAAGTRINLVLSNLLLPLVDGLTLRHANVSTTNTYYIKSAADDTRAAMAKLERLVIGNEASAETEQHENFEVATEAADADAAAIQ